MQKHQTYNQKGLLETCGMGLLPTINIGNNTYGHHHLYNMLIMKLHPFSIIRNTSSLHRKKNFNHDCLVQQFIILKAIIHKPC